MDKVEKKSNINDKINATTKLIDEYIQKKDFDSIYDMSSYIIKNNVSQAVGKNAFSYLGEKIKVLELESYKEVSTKNF